MNQETLTLWQEFAARHALTHEQLSQFKRYYQMVCEANQLFNLTAIEETASFLAYHFDDSLSLGKAYDFTRISTLADVGTGAGFPAIALKIAYPHLKMVLIEVTEKKCQFLRDVADDLALVDIEICSHDWRNFLRKTSYSIDLFCARASLQPSELVRIFQPSSPYKHASLVYWAAVPWSPEGKEARYIDHAYSYEVGSRKRQLIFFMQRA